VRLRLTAVSWALPRFEKLDMGHDIAGGRWLETGCHSPRSNTSPS
jgi:hypothetical protein